MQRPLMHLLPSRRISSYEQWIYLVEKKNPLLAVAQLKWPHRIVEGLCGLLHSLYSI